MRYSEIISEAKTKKLRKSTRHSLPHAEILDADPYTAYRFAVSVAGSPTGPDFHEAGPTQGRFTILPYSDGDRAIIDAAKKKMGIKSKKISKGNSSTEMPGVNTVSPMTPKGPVKRKNK